MEEKQFGELIKRYLAGRATKKEAILIEKWLDQRKDQDPFHSLSPTEKEKIKKRNFEVLSSSIRSSGAPGETKLGFGALAFYRIAAAILLLCVSSYIVWQFTNHRALEKTTVLQSASTTDAARKIILSDSSIVWLKAHSSIYYPEEFDGDERNVKLIGEALFEVTRDPEHPFTIQCGGLTARVLGTSFNIKSSESEIEVLVLTGKLELSSKGNAKGLIVHPNEKAVYNEAQNQMEKITAKENEKTARIAGTQYSMRFHATPMKEIIRRMEGKFDVEVSLGDERLGNCTITADFTDQSLDRTLSMICQTLEIEYERNGNLLTLIGAGCD
jgi:transmembrane sensor